MLNLDPPYSSPDLVLVLARKRNYAIYESALKRNYVPYKIGEIPAIFFQELPADSLLWDIISSTASHVLAIIDAPAVSDLPVPVMTCLVDLHSMCRGQVNSIVVVDAEISQTKKLKHGTGKYGCVFPDYHDAEGPQRAVLSLKTMRFSPQVLLVTADTIGVQIKSLLERVLEN